MVCKIFKTGNSLVISLPKETIQSLGLQEGSEVNIDVDQDKNVITIHPIKPELAEINEEFAQQLNEFIEKYRPALEALAK